jgi:hypothetical protein
MKKTGNLIIWSVLFLVAAAAYSDINSGLGSAGIPPTNGCWTCHHTFSNNNALGSIKITASDSTYSPGQVIKFHVGLSMPGMKIWGFQAAALRTGIGSLHGELISNSDKVEVSSNPQITPVPYVVNSTLGSFPGVLDSIEGWDFSWKAPTITTGGTMTFYVSGVAGDSTGSVAFDYSFSTSVVVPYSIGSSCCIGEAGNIDCDPEDNVDIADLTALVDHLFVNFSALCCYKEALLDNNAWVDIGDLTIMVDHLFLNFAPIQNCL